MTEEPVYLALGTGRKRFRFVAHICHEEDH